MEEEPGEPSGGEELEGPPPRRGKRKRNIIIVVLVVVALVGGAGAYLFLHNNPPRADFTWTAVNKHLSVDAFNSSDPDSGDYIASYTWTWGDGSPPSRSTGPSTTHDYQAVGLYNVSLTVTDSRGGTGSVTKVVAIRITPLAFFIARQDRMTTTFDASGSNATAGASIVAYDWDFGDGSKGTGISPAHTYATPGRYTVTLTVTDSVGAKSTTRRYVSPADTTVDILVDQMFVSGCPYKPYWNIRYLGYGDILLQNHIPCVDYLPWVLDNASINPSWVYSLYHFDARVRNHFGYTVRDPVILPVFNPSVSPSPSSYIRFNLTFDYLDTTLDYPFGIYYWQNHSYPINSKYSDGFGYLVRGTITMDLQESKRIFGVQGDTPEEAQAWWAANTVSSGYRNGPLQKAMGKWLDQQGNFKYDIYNGFEWFYEADITDLNATVAPDGTTTVRVFWDGWGYEVLLSRWFYWGSANYSLAVTSPYGTVKPLGWMPYETCWCENATINGTIRQSLDLDFGATSEYVLQAAANPGRDGVFGTPDDLPAWQFSPSLMDYVPAKPAYPRSELTWYRDYSTPVVTPGSYSYGLPYEYMTVPARWNLTAGNSLTLILPRFKVPWYNPYNSTWDDKARPPHPSYVEFNSTMTLRVGAVEPAGDYYLWDPYGKVISMAGPHDWGTSSLPLTPAPYFEFGPETSWG